MEGRAEQTPITGDPLPWCPPQRNLFPVACEWASDLQEHKRQVHSVSKSVEKTTEPSTPSRACHLPSFLPSFPTQDIKGRGSERFSEKEVSTEKARWLFTQGGIPFYSSVSTAQPFLPGTQSCPPSPQLTSDVSEGGERVPNSGLVKFSQNLGLKRKYML